MHSNFEASGDGFDQKMALYHLLDIGHEFPQSVPVCALEVKCIHYLTPDIQILTLQEYLDFPKF